MTRVSVAVGLFLVFAALAGGCREEPTIVIKFEANDLAAKAAPDLAKVADLAVAETKAPEKKKKGAVPECKVAADCVVEPVDCCDCANGGKQHAVAKKAAAAAKTARAARCKAAMCTMMLSTDPSCGQHADCVDGACALAAKKK